MGFKSSPGMYLFLSGLIFAQLLLSWRNRELTQEELQARGKRTAYSFLEHAGIWADGVLVSYVVSHWWATYQFPVPTSRTGLLMLAVSVAVTLGLLKMWAIGSRKEPDHCAEDGRTKAAGYAHGVYVAVALWAGLHVYLGLTRPVASVQDLVWSSMFLTPWCFLGQIKFNERWRWTPASAGIALVLVILLWSATVIRMLLF
jgi:hypothetical protein